MKVVARVVLNDQEREFDIACGTGERTFKWLANAACQRFALAAPVGALRRCDDTHGITDRVQYTPSEIVLPSGKIPDPGDQLKAHLRYGDQVLINLTNDQRIDFGAGTPNRSMWNADAFTKTGYHSINDDNSRVPGCVHEYFPPVDKGFDTAIQVKAKADFMRLILHSQMINYKVVNDELETAWITVNKAMPNINELSHGGQDMKIIFLTYMGTITDIMGSYATMKGNKMSVDGLEGFSQDAGIFGPRDCKQLCVKTHRRVVTALRDNDNELDLGGFLAALMIIAQIKYHDTVRGGIAVTECGPRPSLQELFTKDILPFAVKSAYTAVLKETFCADEMLYSLRSHHDDLFKVFEKYIARTVKEAASSLKVPDFGAMLSDAGMPRDPDAAKNLAEELFANVREGHIYGRTYLSSDDGKPLRYPYDHLPEAEYSYPEFIEATARAGYLQYWSATGDKSIPQCFMKGVESAVATLKEKTTDGKK